jgi:anionic cell wall polymer biosynthesis LytR-Cps2A-Psr (LCP) family protein
MQRNRKWILAAVIAAIMVLCVCAGVAGYALLNSPLAAPLNLQTSSSSPTEQVAKKPTPGVISTLAVPTAAVPAVYPTASPKVNCGQSGAMNILILGVDSPGNQGPSGPLDIRLVKIDFSGKTAVVFSFPRDLWLPIRGLESYGFSQARLGESYLIARSNAGFTISSATNLVAQNLQDNFGAVSHHYITAKMSTLAAIVDVMGGITVSLPAAYDGTPYGLHYFPAGINQLSGSMALEYATAPSAAVQWGALDRKNLILKAVFNKIFSAEVIPNLPALIPQFMQVATTDLSLQQIMDLICISQQIPRDKITIAGVGLADVTPGGGGVLYPNTVSIRVQVEQLLTP